MDSTIDATSQYMQLSICMCYVCIQRHCIKFFQKVFQLQTTFLKVFQ